MTWSKAASSKVTKSAPFQLVARLGLVAYGLVHLLVAWLVVQVAFGDLDGGGVGKADKTGALQSIAANTGGKTLLWLITVGLAVSALWQLFEAVTGDRDSRQDWLLRAMNLGEAILFGYLSFSAGKLAGGAGGSSTDQAQLGLIGWLLGQSWGKPVVVIIGVAVITAGAFVVHHGLTKQFAKEHDVDDAAGRSLRRVAGRLGQIGYAALGVVYGVAGVLVIVAAVQSQPAKATGLDVALRSLAEESYGPVLLALIAVGLAIFSVFCLFDARYRRVG